MMEKKRSVGVTVIGTIFLGISLIGLLDAYSYYKRGYLQPIKLSFLVYQTSTPIIRIIVGVGLLLLKQWARYLTIILSSIFICKFVMELIGIIHRPVHYGLLGGIDLYIGIIINTLITIYLFLPKVKEQFK